MKSLTNKHTFADSDFSNLNYKCEYMKEQTCVLLRIDKANSNVNS